MEPIELRPERDSEHADGRWLLRAPEAGVFTCSLPPGAALAPGQAAGVLLRLGRATTLAVPGGVHGIVTSARPERVHAPVGAGDVLYELAPLTELDATGTDAESGADSEGGPVVRSPQTGRFYASPSPNDPPFVAEGSELHDGVAVGLIEVMKTFTQITYRAEGGLPAHGKVVRMLVTDGSDVTTGDALIEVAEASGTGGGESPGGGRG